MKKMMKIAATTTNVIAQELPQPSPKAKVEQRIGLTDVTIEYSRPSVKGRVIWGELEAYDVVWRAGANYNTLVSFKDNVKVGGEELKAGTYSFFVTPSKGEWTVMFNSAIDGWGTGKYEAANNVVTLKVEPKKINHQESLRYSIENLTETSGDFVLSWASMSVSFKIEVDVEAKAWTNIDRAIESVDEKTKAKVYRNAAKYAASSKKRLDEGLKWIVESIETEKSWYSYWVKADVQHAAGDNSGAITSIKKAIELGEAGAKESGKPFGYKDRLVKAMEEFK